MSRVALQENIRRDTSAGSTGWRQGVVPWFAIALGAWTFIGCAGVGQNVNHEAQMWGAFQQVLGGDLPAGQSLLPAPVREGHCYRVILGTVGASSPRLSYQGQLDADSVGFAIRPIERRSGSEGAETVAVYGFCSQGAGTVQLQAMLDQPGYGALLEAPFDSLDPSFGQDVVDAQSWIGERQQRLAARRQEAERQRIQALLQQFVTEATPGIRERLDQVVASRGRYRDIIIDEVRGAQNLEEALVLEPGQCFVFAVVANGSTSVEVDVRFGRIRNSAERGDEAGGITYSVCTAPSGPVQEVTFSVAASVPPGNAQPPIYGARVAFRAPSSAERRAADAEWLRNDPEARIE